MSKGLSPWEAKEATRGSSYFFSTSDWQHVKLLSASHVSSSGGTPFPVDKEFHMRGAIGVVEDVVTPLRLLSMINNLPNLILNIVVNEMQWRRGRLHAGFLRPAVEPQKGDVDPIGWYSPRP